MAVAPSTAHAVPSTVGAVRTLPLYFIDSEHPFAAPCLVYVTMSSAPAVAAPDVTEAGFVRIDPTGWCATVAWTVRLTVVDVSPGHPVRADMDAGGPATAPLAEVAQVVRYGIGGREAGVFTYQFEVESRLGAFCTLDAWQMNAVTWRATPLGFTGCPTS